MKEGDAKMVFISLTEDETKVILDCHKHSRDGDYFRLVMTRKHADS